MLAVGCGRIGFDATVSRDSATAPGDAPAPSIAWRKTLVAINTNAGENTVTFTVTPLAAGDVALFHTMCPSGAAPTAVTLSAPGWTFTPISPMTGTTAIGFWTASFGAITPSTTAVTWTLEWTDSSACGTLIALGDEFANVAQTGGAITFDAHGEGVGTGNCATTLTTGYDREALWAACTSKTALVAIEPGYTKAADDGTGDWSEYRIANDPAGTAEQLTFTNAPAMDFAITAVSLRTF